MHQQPVHQGRACKRQPAPAPVAGRADSHDCITNPSEPLEEIVGMSRQAPKTDIADLAPIGVVAAKPCQLRIGNAFPDDGDDDDRDAGRPNDRYSPSSRT